jgi:hypothetical protein
MQLIQGLAGMLFAQEVVKRLSKPGAYNLFNSSYTKIHPDLTAVIDTLIMEPIHGRLGPMVMSSGTKSTPTIGQHYYMLGPERYSYVGLIKVGSGTTSSGEEGPKTSTTDYYVIWEPRFSYLMWPLRWAKGKSPIARFRIILKNRERGSLLTHRVDSTSWHAVLYSLSIQHPTEMKPNQQKTIKFVLDFYRQQKRGTFLFCGPRGTGKTTTAIQLKREIEDEYANSSVVLITNFNPSQVSVDINTLALRDVSEEYPYIIIVNEIESHMSTAAETPKTTAEKRFSHTADRTSFHDMLDTLAASRHVIVIFATERSFEELWAKPEYRSFLRYGRVHGVVHVTHEDAICSINNSRDDEVAIVIK